MSTWQVYAVKYAERNDRTRADSFILDERHDVAHEMDYFIWVIRNAERTIVVDSGYDAAEAKNRGRPILREPAQALAAMGIAAEDIDTLIVTHLHYDHAGGLAAFPNATIHLQEAEMVYATGPCMCHPALQMPFTADHVCEMVRRVYSGRVVFHDGDAQIAEGVTIHRLGGHSRGLQAVRVRTERGWLCLASDAAHFYENYILAKPFPLVVDIEDMLVGFKRIQQLADDHSLIIPGHDPLVTASFPRVQQHEFVMRLDVDPARQIILPR